MGIDKLACMWNLFQGQAPCFHMVKYPVCVDAPTMIERTIVVECNANQEGHPSQHHPALIGSTLESPWDPG